MQNSSVCITVKAPCTWVLSVDMYSFNKGIRESTIGRQCNIGLVPHLNVTHDTRRGGRALVVGVVSVIGIVGVVGVTGFYWFFWCF